MVLGIRRNIRVDLVFLESVERTQVSIDMPGSETEYESAPIVCLRPSG